VASRCAPYGARATIHEGTMFLIANERGDVE